MPLWTASWCCTSLADPWAAEEVSHYEIVVNICVIYEGWSTLHQKGPSRPLAIRKILMMDVNTLCSHSMNNSLVIEAFMLVLHMTRSLASFTFSLNSQGVWEWYTSRGLIFRLVLVFAHSKGSIYPSWVLPHKYPFLVHDIHSVWHLLPEEPCFIEAEHLLRDVLIPWILSCRLL